MSTPRIEHTHTQCHSLRTATVYVALSHIYQLNAAPFCYKYRVWRQKWTKMKRLAVACQVCLFSKCPAAKLYTIVCQYTTCTHGTVPLSHCCSLLLPLSSVVSVGSQVGQHTRECMGQSVSPLHESVCTITDWVSTGPDRMAPSVSAPLEGGTRGSTLGREKMNS